MSIYVKYVMARGAFKLDVEFEAPVSGVTAVFGPSGCGKTTLLRCVAGLERPETGIFKIGDTIWQNENIFLPCHRRSIGFVFQEAGLFTHLTVRGNIEYGLKRTPAHRRRVDFDETVAMLNLQPFLDSRPDQLSGGERRRVAIARALLVSPSLLLMDEPLTGLDMESRMEIIACLKRLFQQLEIPVFYVSHMRDEIDQLASFRVKMGCPA